MKTTNLIESIFLMVVLCLLKLAFLAAGCWMIYNAWYGCGITTIVMSTLIGGKTTSETKTGDKDPDDARAPRADGAATDGKG